ncbi:MAG TPA: potassium transporter TrkG, partial [Spirochaetota bacterium]|nr:potassium transporter TrkG [Spirochaetota bacterium]
LALAILPMIGVGGQQLYAAEVPGPLSSKITTTITQTAKLLWFVYLLISVMEAVSLYAGGMTLYDAVTHTFTTLATGGYSVRNESLAYYSPLLQYIVIFFMFLAGINFSLHYFAFKGSPLSYFKNSEFRFYLFVLLIAAGFIYLNTESIITDPLSRLRHVLFQTVSITTTTGYCSFNFDKWPDFSRLVLVGLMFIGGSGGSTGGGIKCIRVMILFKYFIIQIRKILHPKQVIPLKIGGNVIADKVVNTIVNFILIYIMIVIIAVFIVASQGYDLITSFSSIAATINNIGPGLAGVGAEANFAHLNTITKVVHIACMLAGRLELIAFIILFYPGTWMKH